MSDLPEFEGVLPVGVVTRISGTGQRITRPLHYGEKVLLLVEAECSSVAHTGTNDGMKRVHGLKVEDLYEMTGDDARELLRTVRSEYRAAEDAAAGRVPLACDDSVPAQQYVTDSGTIMLPSEIAEARGETWDVRDVLSVQFADGTKALWPDDWAGTGHSLPGVGGFMRPPTADPGVTVQVVKLLDVDTGAVVAEWTEADEEARLLALEEQLAADEARADREAVEAMPRPDGEVVISGSADTTDAEMTGEHEGDED